MSLINDALKQARKAHPQNTPRAVPPLPPPAHEVSGLAGWLLPSIVVLLILAAIFFIGWAVATGGRHRLAAAPPPPAATTQPEVAVAASRPVIKPHPVDPVPPAPPPNAPKLQGIFYSPTAPAAIIDGKIVRPGDPFHEYKVKAITQSTVTLVGPDKQELQLGMEP